MNIKFDVKERYEHMISATQSLGLEEECEIYRKILKESSWGLEVQVYMAEKYTLL